MPPLDPPVHPWLKPSLFPSPTVLSQLGPDAMHTETFTHSYPYDWRSKQPVILRASRQWFVDARGLKGAAADSLRDVRVIPAAHGHSLTAQLDRRTYWCISRQRAWGVPIPIFYRQPEGTPLITRFVLDFVIPLFYNFSSELMKFIIIK